MTPERFQQIEELYHAARERTAEERAALLAQTDPELRREIESLLAKRTGGDFMDRPAIQNAPDLLEDLGQRARELQARGLLPLRLLRVVAMEPNRYAIAVAEGSGRPAVIAIRDEYALEGSELRSPRYPPPAAGGDDSFARSDRR